MIVTGVTCKKCSSSVIDNTEIKACYNCGEPYPIATLELMTIHNQAKLKLLKEKADPIVAVHKLAENSILAAILYTD